MVEEIIKSIIDTQNTFIGEAPMDVDVCQWIKASAGRSQVYFAKDTYDYPQFDIYVRNPSNEEARKTVDEIYAKVKNYVGNGFGILIEGLPRYIGRDEKYRVLYAFKIEYQLGGY